MSGELSLSELATLRGEQAGSSAGAGGRPSLLYVDPIPTGHAGQHLAFYLDIADRAGLEVHAIAHHSVWEEAMALVGKAPAGARRLGDRIHALYAERRFDAILDEVAAEAAATPPAFIFFPMLDLFVRALARRRWRGAGLPAPWGGVVFRADFNYPRDDLGSPRRLLGAQLWLLLLRYVLAANGAPILSLSPARRTRMPVEVIWLPDALSALERAAGVEAADGARWPLEKPAPAEPGRSAFLLFGHMTPRKGLLETCRAFAALTDAELGRVSLTLMGRFDPSDYRLAVEADLAALSRRGAAISCDWRHAEEAALDDALRRCDFILAPYVGHRASSSVIGLASQYGRPILTPDSFQMGQEARLFDLGVAVDARDTAVMARGLRSMLAGEIGVSPGLRRLRDLRTTARAEAVVTAYFATLLGRARRR